MVNIMGKIVVLDSSVFISDRFTFNSDKYQKLLEFYSKGFISLVLPDVVRKESVLHCNAAIEKLYTDAIKISTLTDALYSRENLLKITTLIQKEKSLHISEVERFLEKFEQHKTSNNNIIDDVLNAYFDHAPPFIDKKKKSEFPDAMTLFSILKSYPSNNIILISKDKDWMSFAQAHEIIFCISVEDCLDKLLPLAQNYRDLIEQNMEIIITNCLNDLEPDMFAVYDDSDGEDSLIQINKIDYDDYCYSVVDASDSQDAGKKIVLIISLDITMEAVFNIFDINSLHSIELGYLEHDYFESTQACESRVKFVVHLEVDRGNNLSVKSAKIADESLPTYVSHGYDNSYK